MDYKMDDKFIHNFVCVGGDLMFKNYDKEKVMEYIKIIAEENHEIRENCILLEVPNLIIKKLRTKIPN